jgi:hypothetical protein
MRPVLRLFILAALLVLPLMLPRGLHAQSGGGPQTASTPAPVNPAPAAAVPSTPSEASAPQPMGDGYDTKSNPGNCRSTIDIARVGATSAYVVQLDPDTLWRPRGTEVRFTITPTSQGLPKIASVQACFRWDYVRDADRKEQFGDSPLVRSVPNTSNAIEYGALIPQFIRDASRSGDDAVGTRAVEYVAVSTVPLAEMQVLVQLENGHWFAVILPVGITNVPTAGAVLAGSLILTAIVLWLWAGGVVRSQDAKLYPDPKTIPKRSWRARLNRHLLAIVSTSNGVASLSQFQIMLWAFVVAGAAVYVMVLSGNLIAISDGTLTLLGIAGGTSVLARVPGPNDKDKDKDANAGAAASRTMLEPRWSQMLIDDPANPEIDVTRVQMLLFTLISAAFVAMKVATSYSIPEIPLNFQLLMGISNGVYLAGRQIPSTPKGTA